MFKAKNVVMGYFHQRHEQILFKIDGKGWLHGDFDLNNQKAGEKINYKLHHCVLHYCTLLFLVINFQKPQYALFFSFVQFFFADDCFSVKQYL